MERLWVMSRDTTILGLSGRGDVFPCGHWFQERRDEFLMGNIINKSFKEIWENDRY